MGRLTRELVDLATGLGGTFFLPYRLHYTPEQLERVLRLRSDGTILRAR